MCDEQEVERLVALAGSLGLGREDLAGALGVLEEDLAGGDGALDGAEVEAAKAGSLRGQVAFLLEHSSGAGEVKKLLQFLGGRGA